MNWGQINPHLNEYHSDPKEISSSFLILIIIACQDQLQEMHSKYPDLSNVARNIDSVIPDCDFMKVSISLLQDVIGLRQSKTTGNSVRKKSLYGCMLQPIAPMKIELTQMQPSILKMTMQMIEGLALNLI
jgi:hypothetical protein